MKFEIDPIHKAICEPVTEEELKTIRIHPKLHEALERCAAINNETIREMAEEAIAFYLEPTANGL